MQLARALDSGNVALIATDAREAELAADVHRYRLLHANPSSTVIQRAMHIHSTVLRIDPDHARSVEAVGVNGIVAVIEYFAVSYRLNERH
jgi:hypothetical protein